MSNLLPIFTVLFCVSQIQKTADTTMPLYRVGFLYVRWWRTFSGSWPRSISISPFCTHDAILCWLNCYHGILSKSSQWFYGSISIMQRNVSTQVILGASIVNSTYWMSLILILKWMKIYWNISRVTNFKWLSLIKYINNNNITLKTDYTTVNYLKY